MIKKLLATLALLTATCWGQTVHAAGREVGNTFTGTNQFTQGVILGPVTVAQLAGLVGSSTIVNVSNGTPGSSPCTAGGTGAYAVYVNGAWTCAGFSSSSFSNLSPGTNTNQSPFAIAPGSVVGGGTSEFSVLGPASDTNTASVVNFDTGSGSHQNSFRAGITGVSELQVCWQPGPEGEIVIGNAVACPNIYTTSYAKVVLESLTASHTILREWQASATATNTQNEWNTASSGTGFDMLNVWTGVTGVDTFHTGGSRQFRIRGDGALMINANYQTLTYNASGNTTFLAGDATSGISFANAKVVVTHGTSSTLVISNPVIGGNYVLKIIQDSTGGGVTLTLGSGCTWLVGGGGHGAITLSNGANAVDILAFTYDSDGDCLANFRNNFN